MPHEEDPAPPQDVEDIKVITNYIRLIRDPDHDVYLYQIKFEPPCPDRKIVRQILDCAHMQRRLNVQPFMMGSKFYLPTKIDDFVVYPFPNPEQPSQTFRITVTFLKQVPLKEQIVLFNCLLKKIMQELNYCFMKTKFFDPNQAINLEEWMMEIWPGYAIEVSMTPAGELLLCCDISHRVLHKTNVYDQLKLLMPNQHYQQLACRHLVGSSVITRYNRQTYRVDDIDFESSPESTFTWGSLEITYREYFKTHWGVDIRYPEQPLLVHRKYSSKTNSVCSTFSPFTFVSLQLICNLLIVSYSTA